MLKNILKALGVIILVVLVALVTIPYFFQDKIKAMIAETINKNVDATVAFEDVDLSLLRSFPRANVTVDKLSILNKAPFTGDTLAYVGELDLKMSVMELFKDKSEPISIESFESKDGLINIIFNKDGVGNFDIAIENAKKKGDGKSDPLALNIKDYAIENYKFRYFDEKSKLKLEIDSLNHSGKGDFAKQKLDLTTKSTAQVSLDIDRTNYMKDVALDLDAVLGIDLDKNRYTFKKNTALINELPLKFDGSIQMVEAGQQYDLTFETASSAFKNFLGLIPSAYSGSLDKVKTTGEFTVAGFAKGLYSDTTVPKFNVAIASKNASFQYPDLPKSVQNIVIDTKIINDSGILNDTYVNLDKLSFKIDQDVFNASAKIRNIVENPLVDARLKGTVNLGSLSQAYPIKLDKPLSGILNADVETKFDMKSVEASEYEKMDNAGNMTLTAFRYLDQNNKAINISKALVQFNTTRIHLQELSATTGNTDLKVDGTLDNFYGFLFKDQVLKGNFNLRSNQFAVADFMSPNTTPTTAKTKAPEAVKIPAFLDCTVTANANTVLYDNLALKNVSGKIIVRDQKATLQNVRSSLFGGTVAVTGDVSTKGKIPVFSMNLGLKTVDIQQTFTQLDMMRNIAPIAGVINGKLNSTIKLSGNLDPKEMTPVLNTMTGNLLAQLLSTTINKSNSPMINKLDETLGFIDLTKLNLNDLTAALTFQDGKVSVKPFNLNYQDIKINVGGQHGFDQSMNYNVKFDVPAKYLGTEAGKILASLSPAEAAKLQSIPITAGVTGTFNNPKITTDLKQAVSNLATQLVKQQKDKLIKQGTSALGNILDGNKAKDTTAKTDAEKKAAAKAKAQDLLNGLFNKKKKEEPKTP
ncbi:MAG TPA: AsmA-like C-terminal region-containing protein [Flavobacterium sp.]|jgi:hypothetical protein